MSRISLNLDNKIDPMLYGDPLTAAVLLSLFSDRRAEKDDTYSGLPRGWWRDALNTDGDRIGSRLWLGGRDKNMPRTLIDYQSWVLESLEWMRLDGVARRVVVVASAPRKNLLWLDIQIDSRGIDLELML